MSERLIENSLSHWPQDPLDDSWVQTLETGKVLFFPNLSFTLQDDECALLTPEVLAPKVRNISLNEEEQLKGAQGCPQTQQQLSTMIARYRQRALQLINAIAPDYTRHLRVAPTSFRPMSVSQRKQSWRADDRRMHVDAFPTRPNEGERILRIFTNLNPNGQPRVWRIGENFTQMANTMLPRVKPYVAWQAKLLNRLGLTKALRSEYDHIMLQLHDQMKADMAYQQTAEQLEVKFPPGSVWVCFSDQAIHGVSSGQFMMEQTLHLPVTQQYTPAASPLAILERMTGRKLVS